MTVYKKDLSKICLFISALWILLVGFFYYPKWNKPQTEATISWDVSGYYFYLPAAFIYKDLKKQSFKDSVLKKYAPTTDGYQSYKYENGNYVMKYSAGMAVCYLPFFLAGHCIAKLSGYPADGFSYPYQAAIGIGSLLVALLGLFFLRKILKRYFSPAITGLVLLLLVFGTNYLEYAAITNAMAHSYLFTIYALLIYGTIRFYDTPSLKRSLLIGLLVGLATLIRPTEIISALIPACWGLASFPDLKARILFIRKYLLLCLAASIAAMLVVSIQLFYWKYVSGHWLVYSYQDEGFNFRRPHVFNCLIRFRKGWLVYTPVMIFSLLGFIVLLFKNRKLFWVTALFSFVFMYIAFSWSNWWYGGGLGQRTMVQAYPILAFPMAAFFQAAWRKRLMFYLLLLPILLFVYHNLWLHHQGHKGGLLDAENMTYAYWKKIVLKYDVPPETKKLLDTDEEFTGTPTDAITLYTSKDSIKLNKQREYTPEIVVQAPTNKQWMRATATFSFSQKEWEVWKMTQMVFKIKRNEQVIKEKSIRLQRFMDENSPRTVSLDLKLLQPGDKITFFVWNPGSEKEVNIANIEVISF